MPPGRTNFCGYWLNFYQQLAARGEGEPRTKNVRTAQPTWVPAGSKYVRIPTDLGQTPGQIRSDGPTYLPPYFRGS